MGNTQTNSSIKLSEKQRHLFDRFPRRGIIAALGLQDSATLTQDRPLVLGNLNYDFEFLTWLVRDTMCLKTGRMYVVDLETLSSDPYRELLKLLGTGIRDGSIVPRLESTTSSIGIDELTSLLATVQPEELDRDQKAIPEGSLFSLNTGLVIPSSCSCYPSIEPLLRVAASANWIIEEKIVQVAGFFNKHEMETVMKKVNDMLPGERFLDLDTLRMFNKPSWTKRKYISQTLRICSDSEKKLNTVKYLMDRAAMAAATTAMTRLTIVEDKPITHIETKRKPIPKAVRNQVWSIHCGECYHSNCYVCSRQISVQQWEAGHVQSHHDGGPDIAENLRPVCQSCNKSMSKTHMWDYIKEYHPARAIALGI